MKIALLSMVLLHEMKSEYQEHQYTRKVSRAKHFYCLGMMHKLRAMSAMM